MYIITIDGPASSGKGTVAKLAAKQLSFNYLESGAIYRAVAWLVVNEGLNLDSLPAILELIAKLDLKFENNLVIANSVNITNDLRLEPVGMMASKLAAVTQIRQKLLQYQRDFAKGVNLVTDGRDMGSVVFPQATLKIYLTANLQTRAKRRFEQLQLSGRAGTMEGVFADILLRDKQDTSRSDSPLIYDDSYKLLDNSNLSIDETVMQIIRWFDEAR